MGGEMKIEYFEGEEWSEGKWHPIKMVTVDIDEDEMHFIPDETWFEVNKLLEKINKNISDKEEK